VQEVESVSADFTEAEYEAAIPECCSATTLEDHKHMMLCWGLAAAIRAGKPMDCTGCDLRKSVTELLQQGGRTND
jgi:hypothetical protein